MATLHGGKRANAGRKTDKDLHALQSVLDEAIPREERVEIFRIASARARSGDSAFAKIVLGYLYGTPIQRMQDENGGAIIRVLRADDRPNPETPPPGAAKDKG